MGSKILFGGLALAASVAFATIAPAAIVLEDHFDYADEAALDATWINVNGQGNYLQLVTSDPGVDHEPYMRIENGLIRRDLPTKIEGADWSLSFKAFHSSKQRGTWVGLLDETGTQGYGLHWDSGNAPEGTNGNGSISIRKFSLASELDNWSVNGVALGGTADSGHEIMTRPFAEIELTWEAATGTLTASVDGVVKLVRTDTDYSSFARIYIKGNAYQLYDDVIVSAVPEPVSAMLVPAAGLLMLRRRR